jgi:hypothetical protein
MVFNVEVETLSVIHFPSSGIKKRFLMMLASKRRLVLFSENETLFPNITRFPVISQILDMMVFFYVGANLLFFIEY